MEVRSDQLDEASLLSLVAHGTSLLCARDFEALSQRFPYALSLGRVTAIALAEDLASCLVRAPSIGPAFTVENARYKVGYFGQNEVTLHALVECRFESPGGDVLGIDWVVLGQGIMGMAIEHIWVSPVDPEA